MAKLELNIYGKNDEILSTYQTDHVRWGLLLTALDLQEKIKDSDPEQQIAAINEFALQLFPGITEAEVRNADCMDVMNVFAQVGRMANKINGKNV